MKFSFKLFMKLYAWVLYPFFEGMLRLLARGIPKIQEGLKDRALARKQLSGWATQLNSERLVYAHVSSVGEYLQLLPVVEKLKAKDSRLVFMLSYFSPSLKRYLKVKPELFQFIFPFAGDSTSHTQWVLDTLKPKAVLFSKFDLWPNLIWQAHQRKIPLFLISATLREGSLRSRWLSFFYGGLYQLFRDIFSVSADDTSRIKGKSERNLSIHTCGDTRVDSVWMRAEAEGSKTPLWLKNYVQTLKTPCLVIGSSWPQDDEMLCQGLSLLKKGAQPLPFCVWVPHETNSESLKNLQTRLEARGLTSIKWSEIASLDNKVEALRGKSALIVDQIGLLVSLYPVGQWAFVGSGLGGVHNILEPAMAGLSVIFGPRYHNAPEAKALLALGAVETVKNGEDLARSFERLLENPNLHVERGEKTQKYLENQRGAAEYCAQHILKGLSR